MICDDRQEWREITYGCKCGKIITHRTEFDQIGLVMKCMRKMKNK